jgi:hypothetical protein
MNINQQIAQDFNDWVEAGAVRDHQILAHFVELIIMYKNVSLPSGRLSGSSGESLERIVEGCACP